MAAVVLFAVPATRALGPAPEFGPPVEVASASGVGSLTQLEAGDINGDGHTDVVVTRIAYPLAREQFPLGLFLGDGHSHFQDGASMFEGAPPRTEHGRQILIADFNGDGRNDIFVADHGYDADPFPGHQNTLALSTPSGKLVDATGNLPPASDYSHSAAAADIDKDGDQDIYVGNMYGGDSPPYLLINDGSGHFTRDTSGRLPAAQTDRAQNRYSRSLFLDANGDGAPDLLLGADSNTPNSVLLANDGSGRFSVVPNALPPKEFGATGFTISMATVDVNEDGKPDLIMCFQRPDFSGRRLQILIGNGDGTFRDETATRLSQQPDEPPGFTDAIRVADLNNDGREDFAVSGTGMTEQLLIYLDDGTGVFRARQTGLPVNVFTFFDADSDGRAEVFSSIGGETEHHSVRRQLSDDDGDGVELAADRCPTLSGSAPTGCPSAGLIAAMPVRVARAGRRIVVRTGVRATCPPAGTVCTGRAVVKMGLRTLSLAKLSIGSGKTASVVLPLRRGASRSLADGRPHRITIALYLTGPDQRTVRTSRRVRVKRRL